MRIAHIPLSHSTDDPIEDVPITPDAAAEIDRTEATHVEGWEFETQSSQLNALPNWYLSPVSLAFSIIRIRSGLVSSASG